MPVTECIAVYIRLSSEDNDVDGSIKAESNSVSAQRMLINECWIFEFKQIYTIVVGGRATAN